jgi:hypothetical protein
MGSATRTAPWESRRHDNGKEEKLDTPTPARYVIAPVAAQFAGYAEPVHQLHTGSGHAYPVSVADSLVKRSGCVRHHKNAVLCLYSGQCRKRIFGSPQSPHGVTHAKLVG